MVTTSLLWVTQLVLFMQMHSSRNKKRPSNFAVTKNNGFTIENTASSIYVDKLLLNHKMSGIHIGIEYIKTMGNHPLSSNPMQLYTGK